MFQRFRRDWQLLRSGAPGERFQRYHRQRRSPDGGMRVGPLVAGALVVLVGIVLLPAPGPGIIVVAVGCALLAGESLRVARLMDRSETALRSAVGRWRRQ